MKSSKQSNKELYKESFKGIYNTSRLVIVHRFNGPHSFTEVSTSSYEHY